MSLEEAPATGLENQALLSPSCVWVRGPKGPFGILLIHGHAVRWRGVAEASSQCGRIVTAMTAILSGLTEDEARAFLAGAFARHPALSFSSRVDPRAGGFAYEIVVLDEELDPYRDVIDAVVARGLPDRLRVKRTETEIAGLVAAVLADPGMEPGGSSDTPLRRLGLLFEYRLVPLVLSLGDICDGFLATSVHRRERAISLAGRCWCFAGASSIFEGPFEADVDLKVDGSLEKIDLRWGEPARIAAAKVIPEAWADVTEEESFGYRVRMRKTDASDGESGQPFAFQIVGATVSGR